MKIVVKKVITRVMPDRSLVLFKRIIRCEQQHFKGALKSRVVQKALYRGRCMAQEAAAFLFSRLQHSLGDLYINLSFTNYPLDDALLYCLKTKMSFLITTHPD